MKTVPSHIYRLPSGSCSRLQLQDWESQRSIHGHGRRRSGSPTDRLLCRPPRYTWYVRLTYSHTQHLFLLSCCMNLNRGWHAHLYFGSSRLKVVGRFCDFWDGNDPGREQGTSRIYPLELFSCAWFNLLSIPPFIFSSRFQYAQHVVHKCWCHLLSSLYCSQECWRREFGPNQPDIVIYLKTSDGC
jgi:hypothetical protein